MLVSGEIRVSTSSVEGVRYVGQDQAALGRKLIAIGAERLAVERQRDQGEFLAIEMQRCGAVGALRVAPDPQARFDPRIAVSQLKDEIDGVDQKVGRPVFGEPHRPGRGDICRDVEHQRSRSSSDESCKVVSWPRTGSAMASAKLRAPFHSLGGRTWPSLPI